MCVDRPALCQAAQESATAARIIGGMAVERARAALEDSEVFQEFAGSEPASGQAAATP